MFIVLRKATRATRLPRARSLERSRAVSHTARARDSAAGGSIGRSARALRAVKRTTSRRSGPIFFILGDARGTRAQGADQLGQQLGPVRSAGLVVDDDEVAHHPDEYVARGAARHELFAKA